MKEEEDYLYGREERDPRKRKRLGDEGGQEEARRSRSRERRRRSRSRESEDRDYRRGGREDEWKKKNDAFQQKQNNGGPGVPQDPRLQQQVKLETGHHSNGSGGRYGDQSSYTSEERRKSGKDREEGEESSGEEGKKTKQGPLSPEQREKLVKQKEQYERAAEKLEDQLLKLKEQREALKLQGQKHEDTIMKENAKLQKEVKYRITYMKDYMVKIEAGLAEDAKVQADAREKRKAEEDRERAWREQENRRVVEEGRKQTGGSGGKGESEEREKKKKSKKKGKSRDRSSSSSASENERKKKKKAKKSRSSDSESSEDEIKKKRKKDNGPGIDEDMFKMIAEMKSRRKKSGGGGADDVLMDLMGKMSESYSKAKTSNAELSNRCMVLEGQNKTLLKRVEELEEQLKGGAGAVPEKRERKSRFSKIEEKEEDRVSRTGHKSGSSERYLQSKGPVPPPALPPRPRSPPRSPPRARAPTMSSRPPPGVPVGANANLEALGSRPPRTKGAGGGGLSAVLALAGGYVAPGMVPPPPQPVAPPPAMVPMPVMSQAREEKSRDEERRGSRKRRDSKSRSRSRSRERRGSRRDRSRDRESRDKNDKIDLDQWVQPPSSQKEAGLTYLKEKMREKQEGYKREEELRSRWQRTESEDPPPPPEPQRPAYEPLAENRSSVAISWGQGLSRGRASAEPESKAGGIKVAPIVGKMPWVKGTVGTNGARKSKFGPPVDGTIPPPSMLTSQPTLAPGTDLHNQDWAPPPGIRTDWGPLAPAQPPAWEQPPDPATYGYGGIPEALQEATPPPPAPEPPKKPSRNPKPSAPMDMAAMLAAAQQHMQKSLATKLQSIGVPVPEHYRQQAGLTNEVATYDLPEAIPLPGDPIGVDMDIADIAIPGDAPDIPLPPGMDDDIAAVEPEPSNQQEDNSEPPGEDQEDPAPPGEEEDDDCRPPGED